MCEMIEVLITGPGDLIITFIKKIRILEVR